MKIVFVLVFTLTLTIIFVFNAHAAGDAAKGKGAYAVCLACHGADGMGNKALNAPQIAGQSTWYLERQLKNFKTVSVVQIQKTNMECKCAQWL